MNVRRATVPTLALATLLSCGGSSLTVTPPPVTVTGCGTEVVANEGWTHVPEGSVVDYRHNPPASGPHYPVWARYQAHATAVPRPYWVHDLEHGAIVLLYNPQAPAAAIDALRAAYDAIPADPACGHKRALITPDPLLPGPTAVVAADVVLQSGCTDAGAISAFAVAHRGHGPEQVCTNGSFP